MQLEQKTGKKEPGLKEGIVGFLFFSIIVFGCNQLLCNSENPEDSYTKEQKDSAASAEFVNENSSMAYQMSKQFLNKRLKAPATADYPLDMDKQFVKYIGDSTFHINSYVDSQNSFGALIRTKYYAILKYEGNDQWSLVDLTTEEQ